MGSGGVREVEADDDGGAALLSTEASGLLRRPAPGRTAMGGTRRKRQLRESVQALSPLMPLDRSKRLWRQMNSTTDPARLCRRSRNREQDKEGCAVWWHAFGP